MCSFSITIIFIKILKILVKKEHIYDSDLQTDRRWLMEGNAKRRFPEGIEQCILLKVGATPHVIVF